MMNILQPLATLIGDIGAAIDRTVTNKEEALEAKHRIQESLHQYKLSVEQELTKRQQIDMTSDSFLSKNIRPLTLIFTTLVVTLAALADGIWPGFVIDAAYINLLKHLMILQYGFYFGSRGIEKIMKIREQRK